MTHFLHVFLYVFRHIFQVFLMQYNTYRKKPQRVQKLVYLHLLTDRSMKISRQSSKQIQLSILNHLPALYANVVTVNKFR